jgi:hypothetical protein
VCQHDRLGAAVREAGEHPRVASAKAAERGGKTVSTELAKMVGEKPGLHLTCAKMPKWGFAVWGIGMIKTLYVHGGDVDRCIESFRSSIPITIAGIDASDEQVRCTGAVTTLEYAPWPTGHDGRQWRITMRYCARTNRTA